MSDISERERPRFQLGPTLWIVALVIAMLGSLYARSHIVRPPAQRVDIFPEWGPSLNVVHDVLFWTLAFVWAGLGIAHWVTPLRVGRFPWFGPSWIAIGVTGLLILIALFDDIAGALAWEIKAAGMTPLHLAATLLMFGLMLRTILIVLTGKLMKNPDTANTNQPQSPASRDG